MNQSAFEYIDANKQRFIDELKSFLRFPSISAKDDHAADVIACADWVKNHLASIGLESKVIQTQGNPIVWARAKGDPSKRIIIYGHYDVQPQEPLDKWKSQPFEADTRDGYIYARGATDDKGQVFAHIKGIEALLKQNKVLPCEVIFLLEGEEECSGSSLANYVGQHKDELKSYAVIVSDGSMYGQDTPAIAYGLRGLVPLEIIVKGPDRDLHSGSFGGAVPNPATALAHIISKCVSVDGEVLIPGFYDDVRPVQQWEKENFARLEFDNKQFIADTGIKNIYGKSQFSVLEKIWARPTFEVNGIYGGYMGQGGKTIIPSYAGAKITMRIVPNMDGQKIGQLAVDHIKGVCPDYVELEIHGPGEGACPVLFDIEHPAIKAAAAALKAGFGKEAVYVREGGSIAVVQAFYSELGCPVVLMGFGNELDGAHSPNERFKIDSFINGAKASAALISSI